MNRPSPPAERRAGLLVLAGLVTGVLALLVALLAAVGGGWRDSAVALVAAALAFGLPALALLRS